MWISRVRSSLCSRRNGLVFGEKLQDGETRSQAYPVTVAIMSKERMVKNLGRLQQPILRWLMALGMDR